MVSLTDRLAKGSCLQNDQREVSEVKMSLAFPIWPPVTIVCKTPYQEQIGYVQRLYSLYVSPFSLIYLFGWFFRPLRAV